MCRYADFRCADDEAHLHICIFSNLHIRAYVEMFKTSVETFNAFRIPLGHDIYPLHPPDICFCRSHPVIRLSFQKTNG